VLCLDRFAHTIGERLDLAITVASANYEEIGDNYIGAEIEQNDVLGFLALNGVNNIMG